MGKAKTYRCKICDKERSLYLTTKKILFYLKSSKQEKDTKFPNGIPVIGYICKYCDNKSALEKIEQSKK